MPGTWATSTLFNNAALSTNVGADQTSFNLPTSNFISRLTFKIHTVGTNTSTLTLDFVRITAAGNATLVSLQGGELRGVNKFQNGTVKAGAAVSTTDHVWVGTINFGRYTHDEVMILPAKLYKQLQLQLSYTPVTAGVTAVGFTLTADEYFSNDDPRGGKGTPAKLVRTIGETQVVASAASASSQVQLNRGRYLRGVYVMADSSPDVNGFSPVFGGTIQFTDPIRIRINNGAETPFEEAYDMARIKNEETYRFDNGLIPITELTNAGAFAGTVSMVVYDFDVSDTLEHAVNTAAVNDISVTWKQAASGTTGNITIISDEFYPVVF